MTTKNDITNDSLITKAPTDAYRANYDSIFKKPKQEDALQELTELSQALGLYEDKSKERCFECNSPEGRHKMDCSSKAVFDAYILLRDTGKWKYFTESMLNALEFKVWTEQQDRKYSNMFDKEED
mgnify:FL=1